VTGSNAEITQSTLTFTAVTQNHGNSRITAIAENPGTRPVKATVIDIIEDTDDIDPSLLRDICL